MLIGLSVDLGQTDSMLGYSIWGDKTVLGLDSLPCPLMVINGEKSQAEITENYTKKKMI